MKTPQLLSAYLLSAALFPAHAALIAWYPFAAGAPLVDASGNGHTLTMPVATLNRPAHLPTGGLNGQGAYAFNGGQRLIVPLNIGPAARPNLTMGAWVRTNSLTPGLRKILGSDDGGWDRTIGLDNQFQPDGGALLTHPAYLRYTSYAGNADPLVNFSQLNIYGNPVANPGPLSLTPTSTTNWTFIAAVYQQVLGKVSLYVDQNAATTADALDTVVESGHTFGEGFTTLAIGGVRPDNATDAWNGAIAQVFIYDAALTAAEITVLRNHGKPRLLPQVSSFTATPSSIPLGGTTDLAWTTVDTATVRLNHGLTAPPGTASAGVLAFSPAVSKTITLTATNESGSTQMLASVLVAGVPLLPRLSEFMANNDGSFNDGNGIANDWIEIHNPSAAPVDLAGYRLQDSMHTWTFPSFIIPADGYRIVVASGELLPGYVDPAGYHHVPFKLFTAGETIRLLAPDGLTLVSNFTALPAQLADVSWGRFGDADQGYMDPPTPGAANGPSFFGLVEDTKFSVDRGFYTAPTSTVITSCTPGAAIAYTLDGSEPSPTHGTIVPAASPAATPAATVNIATTKIVRAMAFRPGWRPTDVDTHTFLYAGDVLDQPANPAGFPTNYGIYHEGLNAGPYTDGVATLEGTPIQADYQMQPAMVNEDRAAMLAALRALPVISIAGKTEYLFGLTGVLANPFAAVNGTGPYTTVASPEAFIEDRPVSMELFQVDGLREVQINCGASLIGGWSRHYSATPKKSIRLSFSREFGPGKLRFPMLGADGPEAFQRINLRAGFSDAWVDNARPAQYLRDSFVREVSRAMGNPASRGNFVHLYINGLYWGIYNPTERPDADFAASHFGGQPADYDAVKHAGLRGPSQGTADSYELLDGTSTRWEQAIASAAPNLAAAPSYQAFKQYVDVTSLADYFIVNSFLGNTDWPGKNWYAFGARTGTFKFVSWDSEYALDDVNTNPLASTQTTGATITPARLFSQATLNADFRMLFADRIHAHAFNGGPLTVASMQARYQALATVLEPAITAEAARWGDNPGTRKGTNLDFRKVDWVNAKNTVLNTFLVSRPAVAMSQYRAQGLYPNTNAPEFTQHGGLIAPPAAVTFVGADPGIICYTTDGSDPRLPGGAVNPSAGAVNLASTTSTYSPFQENGWRYFITAAPGLSASNVVHGASGYSSADWKHPDFVPSAAWGTGRAMLGYGSISGTVNAVPTVIPVNTTIGYGPSTTSRYVTSYFRKSFQVTNAHLVTEIQLDVLRDDGAILYVNGREAGRTNLTAGTKVYGDFGMDSYPEPEIIPITYHVPAGVLVEGNNVLAVEVHNATASSPDLGIDVRIKGVSPGAASIPLAHSANVKARRRSASGEWSALNTANFTVGVLAAAPNLLVSKLHYHPTAPTLAEITAGFLSENDFEYIEFLNYGTTAISLNGVRVSLAIDYTFPNTDPIELAPGQRAVLVASTAAFRLRYGTSPRIIGDYTGGGKLSNEGEEILVSAASGAEILRFTWNNAGAWPDSAAGGGKALVLINQASQPTCGSLSLPGAWRPSVAATGSPTVDDRIPIAPWLATQANPAPLADPEKDGITQLVAFATGAHAAVDPQASLPTIHTEPIQVHGSVDDYHVVCVRLLTGGSGYTTMLESSTELSAWGPANLILISNTDQCDGTHVLCYRSTEPVLSTAPRRQYRLLVTAPP